MDSFSSQTIMELLIKQYHHNLNSEPSTGRGSPFEILILTILSAQTTDEAVDRIRAPLFTRFPNPMALASAQANDIEEIIHSLGFYHVKAAHIIGSARLLIEKFNGRVPVTIDELLTLPGVGRKTANIVLYHAFGRNEGVAVDTHVKRIAQRIGLTESPDPIGIENDLMAILPRSWWGILTDILIAHGRACCTARHPHCDECPISRYCRFFQETKKEQ